MDDRIKSGFEWQKGIWDKTSDIYVDEIEMRFTPIFKCIFDRANIGKGESVLDLGTGTGQVAFGASKVVGESGRVTGIDISPSMLIKARAGAKKLSLNNVEFLEGSAEEIPVTDQSYDIVLSSLCLMYVIERQNAAKEIARVLRPSGRFVACVWAGPDKCDIVKFQQAAGSFAPKPPVEGVGPGALADNEPFLRLLREVGLNPKSELEFTEFEFPNFQSAWDTLSSPTTANLDPSIEQDAMAFVQELMWKNPDEPRKFINGTQFITAVKPG